MPGAGVFKWLKRLCWAAVAVVVSGCVLEWVWGELFDACSCTQTSLAYSPDLEYKAITYELGCGLGSPDVRKGVAILAKDFDLQAPLRIPEISQVFDGGIPPKPRREITQIRLKWLDAKTLQIRVWDWNQSVETVRPEYHGIRVLVVHEGVEG